MLLEEAGPSKAKKPSKKLTAIWWFSRKSGRRHEGWGVRNFWKGIGEEVRVARLNGKLVYPSAKGNPRPGSTVPSLLRFNIAKPAPRQHCHCILLVKARVSIGLCPSMLVTVGKAMGVTSDSLITSIMAYAEQNALVHSGINESLQKKHLFRCRKISMARRKRICLF